MPPAVLPPLDRVDPARAWEPWKPDEKQPWSIKWAGHLYRRAGFGSNLAELREAQKNGLEATLQKFLDVDSEKDAGLQALLAGTRVTNSYQLRGWWLYGMFWTPNPLREKMTLFWHNHFATSVAKVQRPELMQKQNVLLRKHALGKFEPMVQEMSKDPAMLVWLDSNSNVKGKANENYARELMELFTLGVGQYTENDVREAARAFTGWHTEEDQFAFAAKAHDDGPKTILKKTGNWNGDDVVRILLKQDACAYFLLGKLYRYFISETQTPPQALLEPLAIALRKSDYDLGAVVKTMLRSRHFFSDHAYRQRIKCPVEFAVGTVLAVNGRPVTVPPVALVTKLDGMGQNLFAPPNVKGWPGGRAWLNTSTVLARHNFAQLVASGTLKANPNEGRYADQRAELAELFEEQERQQEEQRRQQNGGKNAEEPPPEPGLDAASLVHNEKIKEPAGIANFLLESLLQEGASKPAQKKLIEFLAEGKPSGEALNRRIRATVHAIMTMPEYQLA